MADAFRRLMSLTPYERHKKLVAEYQTLYSAGGTAAQTQEQELRVRTDADVLREKHRFIRNEEEDEEAEDTWETRLAQRYYNKLFKEYAVIDLSRYKEGQYGMRWRSQKEVISSKGQFTCGAKGCPNTTGLASFEVPFHYSEARQDKQALVKVRLCREHASQLHYRKEKVVERRKSKKRRRTSEKPEGNIKEREGDGGGAVGSDRDLKVKSTIEQCTEELQAGAGQVSLADRLLTSVLL